MWCIISVAQCSLNLLREQFNTRRKVAESKKLQCCTWVVPGLLYAESLNYKAQQDTMY